MLAAGHVVRPLRDGPSHGGVPDMKRLSLALALVALGLLAVAPAVQAAPSTAFTGDWIGQDPPEPDGDGSTLHLHIYGGTRPQIVFIDEYASRACDGQDVTVFTSLLRGSVQGDTLSATFNVAKCGPRTLTFLTGQSFEWVLDDQGDGDPSNDTLWDGSVFLYRA